MEQENSELTLDEYHHLVNGRIAGLTLAINVTMGKPDLPSAKQSLIVTKEEIESQRKGGELEHLNDGYIEGTLDVLDNLISWGEESN